MTVRFVVFCLLILCSAVCRGEYVVFSRAEMAKHSVFVANYFRASRVFWDIDERTLGKVQTGLLPYLKRYSGGYHPDVVGGLRASLESGYRFQYFGYVDRRKNKVVLVNALCEVEDGWRQQMVWAKEGGACYFRVRFDVKKNAFFGLEINGEA